jgi:Spy/CpxP family protein refolding chaperone
MRNLNRLLAFVLIVGLVLTTAYFISAQQEDSRRQRPGQGQREGRRQFDPEAMMKQRLDRIVQQLNLSEEETAVLKPKIEGIMQTRTQRNTEMRTLMSDLRTAVDAKDEAQIKAKLDAIKAKRKEHKAQAEKSEQELVELLTVTQEAQFTIAGIVNSDGSGFFGGFGNQDRGGTRGGAGRTRGGTSGNQ